MDLSDARRGGPPPPPLATCVQWAEPSVVRYTPMGPLPDAPHPTRYVRESMTMGSVQSALAGSVPPMSAQVMPLSVDLYRVCAISWPPRSIVFRFGSLKSTLIASLFAVAGSKVKLCPSSIVSHG